MKAINGAVQHEFQAWGRRALPRSLVIQDVDAWALVVSDVEPGYRPLMILELKRSSIEPAAWEPFDADRRNYAALLELANRAGVPLIVCYFVKGRELEDDHPLALFWMTEAEPAYVYGWRAVMPARDFAANFPDSTLSRASS